jgi:hypothetical protein
MPENKEKYNWGLYSLRKFLEYGALFVALWQFGLPAANDYVDSRVEEYHKKHSSTATFRTLLSAEMNIPEDRIHIEFGNWYKNYNQFRDTVNKFLPYIKEELTVIRPRLIVKKGVEFWIAADGQEYRVHRLADGSGSYFANNQWHYIFR